MRREIQLDLLGDPVPQLSFERDAVEFIGAYAKARRAAFSPEEVIAAASAAGIYVHDNRLWGPKFVQAQRSGLIRESKEQFRRVTSNGSKRPGWVVA